MQSREHFPYLPAFFENLLNYFMRSAVDELIFQSFIVRLRNLGQQPNNLHNLKNLCLLNAFFLRLD